VNDAAERVWTQLLAGEASDVPDLGTFSVRVYRAYEGRNPRTGERVHVPEKRIFAFFPSDAAWNYLNGREGGRATPLLETLRAGKQVVFGRVGILYCETKPPAIAHNPQTGAPVEVPGRVMLLLAASRQLKRAAAGEATVPQIASAAVDAALSRLGAKPTTIEELDAELARLGLSHVAAGLVEPSQRGAEQVIQDGDPRWVLDTDAMWDGEHEVAIDRWVAGMLVIATVRSVANGAVLQPADVERIAARLGDDSPFSLAELPY